MPSRLISERGLRFAHVWMAVIGGSVGAWTVASELLTPPWWSLLGYALITLLGIALLGSALALPVWLVRKTLDPVGRPAGPPRDWPLMRLYVHVGLMSRSVPAPVRRPRPWWWGRVFVSMMVGLFEALNRGWPYGLEEGIVAALIVYGFLWVVWLGGAGVRSYVGWPP